MAEGMMHIRVVDFISAIKWTVKKALLDLLKNNPPIIFT